MAIRYVDSNTIMDFGEKSDLKVKYIRYAV